jgi:hypothetical protein
MFLKAENVKAYHFSCLRVSVSENWDIYGGALRCPALFVKYLCVAIKIINSKQPFSDMKLESY